MIGFNWGNTILGNSSVRISLFQSTVPSESSEMTRRLPDKSGLLKKHRESIGDAKREESQSHSVSDFCTTSFMFAVWL